jgi:hypothetical protein
MINRNNLGEILRSGRLGRSRALGLVATGALLLAACSSSSVEDGAATTTTEAVDTSSTSTTVPESTSTTVLDAVVLDPALVGSTGGGSELFPESGNGGYGVSVYDWDLALSDELMSLSGVSTITASATQDLQQFSLDARDLQIGSVTVGGTPAEFSLVGPELVITVGEPIRVGSEFVVEVAYAAEPNAQWDPDTYGWRVVPGEEVFVFGLPGAAATWTPINEDFDAPPARYIMGFDLPDGFTATASGIPTEDDGSGKVVWDTGIGVRFIPTFAVAEFETNEIDWKVPVEVSIRDGILTREPIEGAVLEVLPFVESLFGPYPFERLGISVIRGSETYQGLASQMRVVLGAAFVTDSLLVHEIAHQWVGGAVSVEDETSGWMMEGLAVYTESLWAESSSADIDVDATTRSLETELPPVTRALDDVDSVDEIYDRVTYIRGAMVYHALRLEIGDDAFFVTLREFIQRNLHDTVSVDDLQAVAEEISEQDLDQFFTAWVSEPEVPELPDAAQP